MSAGPESTHLALALSGDGIAEPVPGTDGVTVAGGAAVSIVRVQVEVTKLASITSLVWKHTDPQQPL